MGTVQVITHDVPLLIVTSLRKPQIYSYISPDASNNIKSSKRTSTIRL